ncbi:hypothetical protein AKJ09_00071 [Labilithrix luteola]|uniref:Uncharacterized protein n=1 Tax=Labilithrix luteola TaxID=1391654 RepID=A0A0K1PIR4_9BACT|nr:hypothetical protein AKJ09_00003 [Labilithrix luteola]AKU93407.1 hypothetical protein AKJ09_00071 [Labilithrix luteola]
MQLTPFVLGEAKRLAASSGVQEDDLVQEGFIAVAEAFKSWREDGGAGLLRWVRQPVRFAMLRVIREQKRSGGSYRGGRSGKGTGPVTLVSLDGTVGVSAEDASRENKNGARMERELPLHEVLGAEFEEPPDCLALEQLPALVAKLDERSRQVIRLRYVNGLSHAKVGKKLGISRELARQIEAEALEQMRGELE